MSRPLNRVEPAMPAAAYKTYRIVAPVATHFRPASCVEVDCPNFLNGWKVRTDTLDAQMVHAATHAGRKFQWLHVSEMENWLVFEAGQPCFQASEHRTRLDRPELYVVQGGDHRGNPRGTQARRHVSADDWRDDFAEHQSKLSDEQKKG
ncbi:hypothetical protein [Streptomyces sp. YIM S03343]